VAAPTLDRTIDDYLAFLRVERGLADATIRPIARTSRTTSASAGAAGDLGDAADPAVALPGHETRRGAPASDRWPPTSLRRARRR
jgi:hypothetical protein